jgi:hypothetical protein
MVTHTTSVMQYEQIAQILGPAQRLGDLRHA